MGDSGDGAERQDAGGGERQDAGAGGGERPNGERPMAEHPNPEYQRGPMGRVAAWVRAAYRAAPSRELVAAHRLGAALRLVADRMVATDAPAHELEAAADAAEALAARLSSFRHGGLYHGLTEAGPTPDGYPAVFFDFGPLLGRANPLAPPLAIEVTGGQVIGRVTFGHAYEGPPGCVHGGFIAACFDDVLGLAQSASGEMAMTGTLSVRYLAPTPLHAEVRFVANLEGVDGRKIETRGELWVGERRTARAEAVFIAVGEDGFRQLGAGSRSRPRARAGGPSATERIHPGAS